MKNVSFKQMHIMKKNVWLPFITLIFVSKSARSILTNIILFTPRIVSAVGKWFEWLNMANTFTNKKFDKMQSRRTNIHKTD